MKSFPQWLSDCSRAGGIFNALRCYYWSVVAIGMAIATKALRLLRPTDFSKHNDFRMPNNTDDTRYWHWNMLTGHGFSVREMALATGFSDSKVQSLMERYRKSDETAPIMKNDGTLSILPYPGGRHPRLGFQDGALFPQRETKVSIFAPWDPRSYAVADVPEAIFSDLGLIYLAHTHVPTIWDKQGKTLGPLEWSRNNRDSLSICRSFPNGIEFSVQVRAFERSLAIQLWLVNHTRRPLTRLGVQICVLLGRLIGFDAQTNGNKIFRHPYVACQSAAGNRWIIVASEPCWRVWANPLCPCIHSDARFADCRPGERSEITAWIWFYIGTDIYREFRRLHASGWYRKGLGAASQ